MTMRGQSSYLARLAAAPRAAPLMLGPSTRRLLPPEDERPAAAPPPSPAQRPRAAAEARPSTINQPQPDPSPPLAIARNVAGRSPAETTTPTDAGPTPDDGGFAAPTVAAEEPSRPEPAHRRTSDPSPSEPSSGPRDWPSPQRAPGASNPSLAATLSSITPLSSPAQVSVPVRDEADSARESPAPEQPLGLRPSLQAAAAPDSAASLPRSSPFTDDVLAWVRGGPSPASSATPQTSSRANPRLDPAPAPAPATPPVRRAAPSAAKASPAIHIGTLEVRTAAPPPPPAPIPAPVSRVAASPGAGLPRPGYAWRYNPSQG